MTNTDHNTICVASVVGTYGTPILNAVVRESAATTIITHATTNMMTIRSIFRSGLVLALVAIFAVTTFAQTADPVQRLTELIDLTAEQQRIVQEHLTERTPTASWHLAAALTPTLTDAQKEALFTRPQLDREARHHPMLQRDRGEMRERMQHQRGDRGERGQRPERAHVDRAQMQTRMTEMRAARNEALGLTAEQAQRLDAVTHRRQATVQRDEAVAQIERRAAMQQREALPAAVAEILTDEQAEIWRVHSAIARHAMMRHVRGAQR